VDLVRSGRSPSRRTIEEFVERAGEPAKLVAMFGSFGSGLVRTGDFSVAIEWADVEKLIARFAESKHPEAVRLQACVQLAEAVEKAGWSPIRTDNGDAA
jgi:hypothetical protein